MENSTNKKKERREIKILKIVRKYFKTEENNVENFHILISDLRLHEYAFIRFIKLNFIYLYSDWLFRKKIHMDFSFVSINYF